MLIWFLGWLIADIIFLLTLSRKEYLRLFHTKEGLMSVIKFIPIRFFLWPFLLVAIIIDLIDILTDFNKIDFWWFDVYNIKM